MSNSNRVEEISPLQFSCSFAATISITGANWLYHVQVKICRFVNFLGTEFPFENTANAPVPSVQNNSWHRLHFVSHCSVTNCHSYQTFRFLQKQTPEHPTIMPIPSVSYSTILFLLLLIVLSPRIFLILLAIFATTCVVLEQFVKIYFLNSPQYLLRFGTWCLSSSIVSIAVYIGLCFIKIIYNWISRIIQLSLYRLHFLQLICIPLISSLVLQAPKLWAAISWISQHDFITRSNQSCLTPNVSEPLHLY